MSVLTPVQGKVLLNDITWETYERLLREVGERPIRFTFDNGNLEITTLSFGHEHSASVLSRFVEILTLELNLPLRSGGSTTLRTKLKRKGLEPDRCFWIRNERKMRGKKRWRAGQDPSPDLAIEVDVTRSSLNRIKIYAALKVGEVWRYAGGRLRVYILNESGKYEASEQSDVFPYLPMKELLGYLKASDNEDETSLFRRFSAWVREQLLPAYEAFQAGKHGNGRKSK